jgi:hypothetical protein
MVLAVATLAAVAGCGGTAHKASVCASTRMPANSAFVFVDTPRSGERVSSAFRVSGCSSTFEGNVTWTLRARDGRVLARGFTQGGSVEPGPFEFTVRYTLVERQVGQLEVSAPRVTSEGFPPVRNVLPLVLEP